jgi:hypothetical protein
MLIKTSNKKVSSNMKRDAQGRFLPKSAPQGWTDKGCGCGCQAEKPAPKAIEGLPMKEIVAIGQKAISLLGTDVIQQMEAALIRKYQNEPIFLSNMEKLLPIYLKLGMTDVANTVVDKMME